jgi:hypothetical protein
VITDRQRLVQSVVVKAQRKVVDEIGTAVGTPVVYLKAAWADPVLYGGRGERMGSDIDALVRPARFEAFTAELARRGFRRMGVYHSRADERYFGAQEQVFAPPTDGLVLDLHRAVTNPIWFTISADDLIDRAIPYESVDGPILSLAPEDQVLYGALHYANHGFELSGRHLEDVVRVIAARAIDWPTVAERARVAKMQVPLLLFLQMIRDRGGAIPPQLLDSGRVIRVKAAAASAWIRRRSRPGGRSRLSRVADYILLAPLLSERPTALLEFTASHAFPWVLERMRAARQHD